MLCKIFHVCHVILLIHIVQLHSKFLFLFLICNRRPVYRLRYSYHILVVTVSFIVNEIHYFIFLSGFNVYIRRIFDFDFSSVHAAEINFHVFVFYPCRYTLPLSAIYFYTSGFVYSHCQFISIVSRIYGCFSKNFFVEAFTLVNHHFEIIFDEFYLAFNFYSVLGKGRPHTSCT